MIDNKTLRMERTFRAPAEDGWGKAFDNLERTLEAARPANPR
jgi:hypothetical protein